jgi:type IV secretory pathway VirB4 component
LYEINNHNIPIIFTNNNRFAIEISKGKYLADIESITSAKINLVSSNNIETRTPSQMKDKVKTSSELTVDQLISLFNSKI